MKELSIEEKAKAYDEALEKLRNFYRNYDTVSCLIDVKEELANLFPELKESEDERIKKVLIDYFNRYKEQEECGIKTFYGIPTDNILAWLEKQGKQEQLYIRFGEIPTDEKSKIFQGEIEVGTENGVSVYPALKTSEGDIVLGLSLPITKTTLYTQQHLIEYDDRPCYLVRGDYVGKDTDGQPLINNVSIIEKIDTYRVKEKKQGEHKLAWSEEDKKLTDVNHEYFSELLENNNSKDINDYAYQVAYCMSHDWIEETATWDDVQKACKLGAKWQKKHDVSEEWSEEDEKMIDRIRGIVEAHAFSQSAVDVNGELCEREYIEADNWLKSLKGRT